MMAKQEPVFIPQVHIYNHYSAYSGYFGDLPLYDTKNAEKSLNSFLNESGRAVRFKDVCFGPYIDFSSLQGMALRPVDDCLVACDSRDNTILIYDRNPLDNEPKKINWLNYYKKQEPIFFEPQLCLFASPKEVNAPKYKSKEQSCIETEVFKIIQDMGFDFFESNTENRFFKPLPKVDGKPMKEFVAPDSAFLLKCGPKIYAWYVIYGDKSAFKVSYFQEGELKKRVPLPNVAALVKNLQQDRISRNKYIERQYDQ